MILQINPEKKLELIIQLLEILIWPITFLIVLLLFRKYFNAAISQMGSFKAGASGIEMTFDKNIAVAKKLLKAIDPKAISKSASTIKLSNEVISQTPYLKLLDLKNATQAKIAEMAADNDINVAHSSSKAISNKLAETGVITLQKAKLMDSMIDLANTADVSFSEVHLKIVQDIDKAINK